MEERAGGWKLGEVGVLVCWGDYVFLAPNGHLRRWLSVETFGLKILEIGLGVLEVDRIRYG